MQTKQIMSVLGPIKDRNSTMHDVMLSKAINHYPGPARTERD